MAGCQNVGGEERWSLEIEVEGVFQSSWLFSPTFETPPLFGSGYILTDLSGLAVLRGLPVLSY